MNKVLLGKVRDSIRDIKTIWPKLGHKKPFIAFSTGKDSLAMTGIIREALPSAQLPCLYSHHGLEFSSNLDYLEELRPWNLPIKVVKPFLGYFELMKRGIGFLTLKDPWCVPMLVGTGMIEWLRDQGARGTQEGFMFRGMSGGEYSHKYHSPLELYRRLDLPCFNPMLRFTREEIITIATQRYGFPLNPIYEHMDRTYCICCYTSDAKRQAYSRSHHPQVCRKYYRQIDRMLFGSGLLDPKQAYVGRCEGLRSGQRLGA